MGESLSQALEALGRVHVMRTEQDQAARIVLTTITPWAIPYFRRKFQRALRLLAPDERDEVLRHALDDVVLTARRGAFRGGNEHAAHAWCKHVMRHRLLTDLRRRSACPPPAAAAEASAVLHEPAHAEDGGSEALTELVARLEAAMALCHRARDLGSVMLSFRCYLASRLGEPASAGLCAGMDGRARRDDAIADRNLLYQRRRRGKRAALRALRTLAASGAWDASLARAASMLGLMSAPDDLAPDSR